MRSKPRCGQSPGPAHRPEPGRHPSHELRRRQDRAPALLVPVQRRAPDPLVAGLGLGHPHAALVHAQHALGHRLDRIPHRGRRLARAHRPVGEPVGVAHDRGRDPGRHRRLQQIRRRQPDRQRRATGEDERGHEQSQPDREHDAALRSLEQRHPLVAPLGREVDADGEEPQRQQRDDDEAGGVDQRRRRQRRRREESGDDGQQRWVAGQEGAHAHPGAVTGATTERRADPEAEQQQHRAADDLVVGHGRGQLARAQQGDRHREAQVAGVDDDHAADQSAEIWAAQP